MKLKLRDLRGLPLPSIMKRSNVELGDTGQMNMQKHADGALLTMTEYGTPRASIILNRDQLLFTIRSLCTIAGIPIKEGGLIR